MADIADIASERTEQTLQGLLAGRVQFGGTSETHCLQCTTEIPQRRQELLPGVSLCVDCQQLKEEKTP